MVQSPLGRAAAPLVLLQEAKPLDGVDSPHAVRHQPEPQAAPTKSKDAYTQKEGVYSNTAMMKW